MSAPPSLTPSARAQLALYRMAASGYRGALMLRLLFPCEPQRRRSLRERLGRWQPDPHARGAALWLHAASLGEVHAAMPLLAEIRRRRPDLRILVTCQTASGYAAAERTAADEVRFFAIDTPAAVASVLAHARPRLFVAVETEIWPSLLLVLARHGVRSAFVNATVSERSFRRYGRARALFSAALATVSVVCARDETAASRLARLGVRVDRIRVCGDLKSDMGAGEALASAPDPLADVDAPVLVAASTHPGEDEVALAAFAVVRSRHSTARLLLAPRHPERSGQVAAAAQAAGWRTRLRTREGVRGAWDVLVLDTTGELKCYFKSAAAVFVGGSLDSVGGHNLFEPAMFARPLAAGPQLDGVREQADALLAGGGLCVVADAAGLAQHWLGLLDDPAAAQSQGGKAREAVLRVSGALARTLKVIEPLLAEPADGRARGLETGTRRDA